MIKNRKAIFIGASLAIFATGFGLGNYYSESNREPLVDNQIEMGTFEFAGIKNKLGIDASSKEE